MAEIFKLLNSASSKLMHNKNIRFKDIDMCMIRNRNDCKKKVSLIFFKRLENILKLQIILKIINCI